jgi:hypothetical protein
MGVGADQVMGLLLRMEEAKGMGREEAKGGEGVVVEGRGAWGRRG